MKIKIGESFTLLLTDRGEVYSWGYNFRGQLGIGIKDDNYHTPTKIDFILGIPIRYISAGGNHAAAIDFDYNVYIWGYTKKDLGIINNINKCIPTIIEKLTEKKVEKIYCETDYTYVLTQNGEVYSWGNNNNGILGIGHNIFLKTPTKINFPHNAIIKKLYTGINSVFALDTDSKIYSVGTNYYRKLCNNNRRHQYIPTVASMLNGYNVNKIINQYNCTIILADNKLYIIGYDNIKWTDKLGEYNITEIKIEGDVEKIWGSYCTVFCKMCNGDIYAWGFNKYGQLGIGNKLDQNIPVKLNMTLDIKSINNDGDGTTYAITTNGEIYTWGINKLVDKNPISKPTLFTYFTDNNIEIKTMTRTKSARKNFY